MHNKDKGLPGWVKKEGAKVPRKTFHHGKLLPQNLSSGCLGSKIQAGFNSAWVEQRTFCCHWQPDQ